MTKSNPTLRASDVDGTAVVRVQMSNAPGTFATFEAADYDRLRKQYPGLWRLNDNGRGAVYVRAVAPGAENRNVNLARETLQPGPGRVVRYLDGDRLNLRRANLYVDEGTTLPRQSPADRAARDAVRVGSEPRKLSGATLQAALR